MLPMPLKTATLALALAAAAAGADRSMVVVQGRPQANAAHALAWTLLEKGALSRLAGGDGCQVPGGRSLVVTEAAFTVRGPASRFTRGAHFRLSVKAGQQVMDLAEFSGRLMPHMAANTVSRTFSPGLPVPAGAEVRAVLAELQPPDSHVQVEVTLYGYFD